jgi:hypothetical protein
LAQAPELVRNDERIRVGRVAMDAGACDPIFLAVLREIIVDALPTGIIINRVLDKHSSHCYLNLLSICVIELMNDKTIYQVQVKLPPDEQRKGDEPNSLAPAYMDFLSCSEFGAIQANRG